MAQRWDEDTAMSININRLERNFFVVDDRMTGRQAAEAAHVKAYLVIRFASGQYALAKPEELMSILKSWKVDNLPLAEIPAHIFDKVFARRMAGVIQQDTPDAEVLERVRELGDEDRLVVLADGQVVGLLSRKYLFGARGSKLAKSQAQKKDMEFAGPPPADQLETAPPEPQFSIMAAEDESSTPPPPPAPLASEKAEPQRRYINVELEGHDKAQPLQMGEIYNMAFDVDVELRQDAVGGAALAEADLFKADETEVRLSVQLASDDFDILSGPGTLLVPRKGKSKNKATFQIMPRHEGEGVINAVFLKEGVFVQVITLRLNVGQPDKPGVLSAETQGRTVDAAFQVPPRELSLTILYTGTGFQVVMSGAVAAIASLPLSRPELEHMIAQMRQELKGIVDMAVGSQKIYQTSIDIPAQANQAALQRLARAGFNLYRKIFYGPAADAQARLLGDRLRQIACQSPSLKIQIFSQHFMLPWGILYMADRYDPDHIDPELFLGLRHIIEHIPLQPSMQVLDSSVKSQPQLTVSLNVNTDIDTQMQYPLIANQVKDWQEIAKSGSVQLVERKTRQDLTQALASSATPDHILYFYCHADSKSLAEGGPDASTLVLSGNGRVTLGDLNLEAPTDVALPGAPLVFINACQSAELSPIFYDGFVPYFMAKGARGVIGTECDTPALFAAEWARRFFRLFLSGSPLGQAFLELRREFYYQHNNLMGLLYALYCDGDTQVTPGLPLN